MILLSKIMNDTPTLQKINKFLSLTIVFIYNFFKSEAVQKHLNFCFGKIKIVKNYLRKAIHLSLNVMLNFSSYFN